MRILYIPNSNKIIQQIQQIETQSVKKEKAKANDANASLSYAVHSIAQESRSNQTQDMNRIYSTVFLLFIYFYFFTTTK